MRMLLLQKEIQTTYRICNMQSTERIQKILVHLGYKLIDRGRFWQTSAVYRDGDNRTALQIWKDTGTWKDFVKNTPYLSFEKLVRLSNVKEDCAEIDEILNDYVNNDPFHFERQSENKMPVDQFFDHEEVKTLLPHYSFYNKKGISDSTLKRYKAGFSMSRKMNGRFVFPIFDRNGKVVGVTGRHLLWKSDSPFPKWKHLGRKANWIYPSFLQVNGVFKFQESIEKEKQIILIEGIGDSLALTEQGVLNHMVLFGLDISPKQIAHLSSLSLDKIIIATNNDKDKEQNRGFDAAVKIFLKLIQVFDVSKVEIKLPFRKDFGEMLENGDNLKDWKDGQCSEVSEIYNKLKKEGSPPQNLLILKNYMEQLNAERNTISK